MVWLGKCILPAVAVCCFVCGAGMRREPDPRTWSSREWIAWRDAQIAHILEPTFAFDGEVLIDNHELARRAADAYSVVTDCTSADPSFFSQSTDRGRRMANFVR